MGIISFQVVKNISDMVVHDCSLHDLNPEVVADHMHKSGTQAARIILKIAMKILLVGLLGYLIGVHFITKPPEDQLEKFNSATTALMERLVSKKYFRLIRLNLNSECPLKFINKICKSKSCSVCRCDSKDIPSFWSKTDRVLSSNPNEHVDLW